MSRAVVGSVVAVAVGTLVVVGGEVAAGQEPDGTDAAAVEVTVFYMDGCPYCAAEREFLDELLAESEGVVVEELEISGDAGNRQRFRDLADEMGFDARVVPTTIIGDRFWVGFNDAIAEQIATAIEAELTGRQGEPAAPAEIDVPGFGNVDLSDRSLLLSTLLIGFVDGFNPCSLWVLSLLLALVLHSGSRRRVIAVGVLFLTITTALYGLFIIGIYSVLSYVAYLTWIQRAVAAVAATFAVINIKDYFRFQKGVSLSISEAQKPGLYRRMRALGRPGQPLGGVLAGTAALAVGVSLVETPCTAGFPIVWTDLLAARDVNLATAATLFTVYMAVFLVDELAVFGAAVVTMRATRLQEEHGRVLKLVAGVVMLALAVTMVVDPDRLTSIEGTIVVFGSAGLAAALVAALDTLVSERRRGVRHRDGVRHHDGDGVEGEPAEQADEPAHH